MGVQISSVRFSKDGSSCCEWFIMTTDFDGFREVKHLLIIFSLYRFEFHTKTLIFIVFEISNFVLTKQHLREVLIFCFNWKKSAAEAHRMLVEVYGDTAPTDKSCREWFRRFKDGDFSVEDKPRSGQPKKFEDKELEALLEEDQSQTQEELAKLLGVTKQAVMIESHGNDSKTRKLDALELELKPRDVERRFFTCEQLIQR